MFIIIAAKKSYEDKHCFKFLIFFSLPPFYPSHLWQEVAVATVICKGKLQGIEVGHFMGGDVGIYTNVYTYIPWIEKNIKERVK